MSHPRVTLPSSVLLLILLTVIVVAPAAAAPPIAVADTYVARAGKTLTVAAANGLLVNDYDPDGDPLTATSFFTVNTQGTVSVFSNGSFTYFPPDGFTGVTSFTYRISDGGTLSVDFGTVTLIVIDANTVPFVMGDRYIVGANQTISEPAPGPLANDFDIEGDALTVDTSRITQPQNGTLTLFSDGFLIYVPNTGFFGVDVARYVASDGLGNSKPGYIVFYVGQLIGRNLITNGSIELPSAGNTKLPEGWTGVNVGTDGRVCNKIPSKSVALRGNCALMLAGSGEATTYKQDVSAGNLVGLVASDNLRLSAFVRGPNGISGLRLMIKVSYHDPLLNPESIKLNVPVTQFYTHTITPPLALDGMPKKITSSIRFNGVGKVHLDDISLIVQGTAAPNTRTNEATVPSGFRDSGALALPLP